MHSTYSIRWDKDKKKLTKFIPHVHQLDLMEALWIVGNVVLQSVVVEEHFRPQTLSPFEWNIQAIINVPQVQKRAYVKFQLVSGLKCIKLKHLKWTTWFSPKERRLPYFFAGSAAFVSGLAVHYTLSSSLLSTNTRKKITETTWQKRSTRTHLLSITFMSEALSLNLQISVSGIVSAFINMTNHTQHM